MGLMGGAMIYIRESFKCVEINLDTPLECISINVVFSM